MLFHDVWFYLFLVFLVEHGVVGTLLFLAVRKLRGLKKSQAKKAAKDWIIGDKNIFGEVIPTPAPSTLRARLQQSREGTAWTSQSTLPSE